MLREKSTDSLDNSGKPASTDQEHRSSHREVEAMVVPFFNVGSPL